MRQNWYLFDPTWITSSAFELNVALIAPNLIAESVSISPSYYLLHFPQWKATPFRKKNSLLGNYELKLYSMSSGTGDNKKTISSWCCRNCCCLAFVLWFGYFLLTLESFVSFVSSHLVITPSTTIHNTNKLNFHSLFFQINKTESK